MGLRCRRSVKSGSSLSPGSLQEAILTITFFCLQSIIVLTPDPGLSLTLTLTGFFLLLIFAAIFCWQSSILGVVEKAKLLQEH